MEWGVNIEALQEMQAKGVKVRALEDAPVYREDIAVFVRAYSDLSSDRNFNGVIPFTAVMAWASLYGVPITECWEIVRIADIEVRKWQHSSSAKSK